MSLSAVKKQKAKPAAQVLAGHATEQQTNDYPRDRDIEFVDGPFMEFWTVSKTMKLSN